MRAMAPPPAPTPERPPDVVACADDNRPLLGLVGFWPRKNEPRCWWPGATATRSIPLPPRIAHVCPRKAMHGVHQSGRRGEDIVRRRHKNKMAQRERHKIDKIHSSTRAPRRGQARSFQRRISRNRATSILGGGLYGNVGLYHPLRYAFYKPLRRGQLYL